jgi:hypothetical protein
MEYPNGYSEAYPWPRYGEPGEVPIVEGTNVRPDVLTDRAALVALRAWVLQERDHALRITIGSGAASSLRFAIAMTDVAAVLCRCIEMLPPELRVLRPTPRPRPRPVPRLRASIEAYDVTDPALPILDQTAMHY